MTKRKVQDTSLEAYRNLNPDKISQTQQKIINALAVIQKGHYQDIAKKAGLKEDSCWKRLSELCTAKLIERTGARKNLKSGTQGSVWTLTEAGRKAITEGLLPGKTVADFSKSILNQPKQSPHVIEKLF